MNNEAEPEPGPAFTLGEVIERALICQGPDRSRFLDDMLGADSALRQQVDSIVRLGSIEESSASSSVAVEIARRYRRLVQDARAEAPPMALFLRYLDRSDAGETITIDHLCQAHPEEAEDLQAIGKRWSDFRSALKPGADSERDRAERCARDLLQLICAQTNSGRRYTEVRDLGEGGMGKVAEVMDLRLGRSVARKTPNVQGPEGFSTIRRLLKEARITAYLEHPGVVPVHELGVGPDGTPYFTMRVVNGVTLRQAIRALHAPSERTGPPTPWKTRESLLSTLVKICDTIAYAHTRGVIHRDLKPDNVLLGRFGEAYVMDWGLAHDATGAVSGHRQACKQHLPEDLRTEDGLRDGGPRSPEIDGDPYESIGLEIDQLLSASLQTHAKDIIGTPCFMPPEQAANAHNDPAATFDIYSLGAILYQILAGVAPYAERSRRLTARQAVERLRRGPPRPIADLASDVPDELIAICEKSMARTPEQRYPNVIELRNDLVAFLEGRVVRAHCTGARVVAKKWASRNPTLATALIALLLLSTTLALVMFKAERANSSAVEARARLDIERANAAKTSARQERIEAVNGFFADAETLENTAELFDSFGERPDNPEPLKVLREIAGDIYDTLDAIDEHLAISEGLGDAAQVAMLRTHRAKVNALADDSNSQFCLPLLDKLIDQASWTANDLSPDQATLWMKVIRELSSDPRFSGVPLSIQGDLIPLGQDPGSGLQEFGVKDLMPGSQSVWLPVRDDEGVLQIHEDATIVLVLLPPANRVLGMVDERFSQPGQDSSPHPVQLPAYLIAKYELTHAQLYALGAKISEEDPNMDGRGRAPRPAVGCTARSTKIPIGRYGFRFPTVDEWENAARGDNEGPIPGNLISGLPNHANFFGLENAECRDATRARGGFDQTTLAYELRDERIRHAPLDDSLPNSFGLFSALGNVAEISVRGESTYALGGSFLLPYFELRYSARREIAVNESHLDVGFRLVRDYGDNVGATRKSPLKKPSRLEDRKRRAESGGRGLRIDPHRQVARRPRRPKIISDERPPPKTFQK